jgi:hypothetical protein
VIMTASVSISESVKPSQSIFHLAFCPLCKSQSPRMNKLILVPILQNLVGVTGFEPASHRLRGEYVHRWHHTPKLSKSFICRSLPSIPTEKKATTTASFWPAVALCTSPKAFSAILSSPALCMRKPALPSSISNHVGLEGFHERSSRRCLSSARKSFHQLDGTRTRIRPGWGCFTIKLREAYLDFHTCGRCRIRYRPIQVMSTSLSNYLDHCRRPLRLSSLAAIAFTMRLSTGFPRHNFS